MGWTFSRSVINKKDIISQVLTENGYITKHSVVNNEMWAVEERPGKPKQIVLFLLSKQDGHWGYKDITEAQGPFYFSCPQKYLKETPVQNQNWRDGVGLFHTQKTLQRNLRLGATVVLHNAVPNEFVISCLKPLKGIASNGKEYKLVRSGVIEVR